MNTQPFVSIVMPALNEEMYIGQTLEALHNIDYPRDLYEIIVVDNGSTDRTTEIVQSFEVSLLYEPSASNVGAVRNAGVRAAKGEIIAFLDSDCLADSDWISKGLRMLEKHPKTAIGGGYRLPNSATWIEKYWVLEKKEHTLVSRTLLGCNIMLRRSALVEVGGFNEHVTSGEDSELHRQLLANGTEVLMTGELSVVHLGNAKRSRDIIRRQCWHGENYLRNLPRSLGDPIFLITLVFVLLPPLTIALLLQGMLWSAAVALSLLLLLPLILSVKRICRSDTYRVTGRSIIELAPIYVIDLLYLIGRSIGILKSVIDRFGILRI